MKFIDEVVIEAKSGDGGPGAVSFLRQKYRPKMGPNGGDGGRGGHVYFEATHNLQSLLDFKFNPRYHAENGEPGGKLDCNGKNGSDLIIQVPVGTSVIDVETNEVLVDLVEPQQRVMLLKGGSGGLGNMNFATPTRQAPDFAQPGRPGKARKVKLELKLMADVGLVGFPNAGKSTLISRLSAAKPKIADYPFTTLVPNLGVVRGKGSDFVLADIPGIIEGASEGKGLGLQFLRHCERTRLLLILLDLNPDSPRSLPEEYNILREEMHKYSPELFQKPFLVVLNKIDLYGANSEKDFEKDAAQKQFLEERGFKDLKTLLKNPPLMISAVSGAGLEVLRDRVEAELAALGPREQKKESISATLSLGNAALFSDDTDNVGNFESDTDESDDE